MKLKLALLGIIIICISACGCIDNTADANQTISDTLHIDNPDVPVVTDHDNGEQPTTLVKCSGMQFENTDSSNTVLTNNVSSVDVTYDQLLDFLREDKTSQIPYVSGSFECPEYALTLHNNAEKAGIDADMLYVHTIITKNMHLMYLTQLTKG
jgi:hypothetical protein